MPTGFIRRPLHSKGYGFIEPDGGGKDVFLHVRSLVEGEETDLVPGVRLSYRVQNGTKGPQAADVRILGGDPAEPGLRLPDYPPDLTSGDESSDWRITLVTAAADARALADDLDRLVEQTRG